MKIDACVECRGELGECDFEQENDLTFRTDVRSHPIETALNGAIRIHYLTDNVDFRSARSCCGRSWRMAGVV